MRRLMLLLGAMMLQLWGATQDVGLLVTGGKQGTYYAIGMEMQKSLLQEGLQLQVAPSQGSIHNLDSVAGLAVGAKADFGIAQSDVFFFLQTLGKGERGKDIFQNYKLLLKLYSEEVHLLAPSGKTITLPSQKPLHVVCGTEGSGSCITAQILSAVLKSKFEFAYADTQVSLEMLQQGKADLGVFVFGKPAPLMQNLKGVKGVTLAPTGALKTVYGTTQITSQDYAWVTQPFQALTVDAVLFTHAKADPLHHERTRAFLGALSKQAATLTAQGHPKWKQTSWRTSDTKRFHPVALELLK